MTVTATETETILRTAAATYLAMDPAVRRHAPEEPWRMLTIGDYLDELLRMTHGWEENDLAACLLILALARKKKGGIDRCGLALRHALADLGIDLPMSAHLKSAGSYTLLAEGPIPEDAAKDLCALLSQIGCYVALETVLTWSADQQQQAELYARRRRQRTWKPVDVPERPSFLPVE